MESVIYDNVYKTREKTEQALYSFLNIVIRVNVLAYMGDNFQCTLEVLHLRNYND